MLLGSAGRGHARVLVEVTRLLHDAPTGGEDGRLALDLGSHGTLHRAQGVDVLGLRACAPGLAGKVEGEIGIAAQRALLHLDVGYAEPPHDVAQLGDIGASDLGRESARAGHRLRDDLHERDPRTVVVDQGVVGPVDAARRTAGVRELAGVLFQVHPLDPHTHDHRTFIRGHRDIQVAVDAQGLVVLADLVVLGHVGVEVVLARHATPLGDGAVEREADPDRGLDRHGVHHRHRPRQAEADGAHLSVGWRTESGRATAEDLGLRAEFDVDLHADDGLELRDGFGEGNGGGHSDGTSSMSRWPHRSRSAPSSAPPTR